MGTAKDRFWVWGHDAGCHNAGWGIPRESRMTPAEGAFYLGVPNLIFVRYEGKPEPPFDRYARAFSPLRRVVWSIVGAGGATDESERDAVLRTAEAFPNITGVMMDDFFHAPSAAGEVGSLSLDVLRGVRDRLVVAGRRLDLWVVLYDHQLNLPVRDHLSLCDTVTFWTWEARNLANLEANFARAEALAPSADKVLGCYLWDYGTRQPMPIEAMRGQCELGLRWLREGRVQGMIFLASCICDLDIPAVEWTKRWIGEIGDAPI